VGRSRSPPVVPSEAAAARDADGSTALAHWIRRRDEYKYRAAVAATVGRATAYPDAAKEWGRYRRAGPTIPLTTLMSAASSEEEDAPGPCHDAVGSFGSL
jgi:hypothetical protein